MNLARLSRCLDRVDKMNIVEDDYTEITSLAYDSRKVQPGGLFVAVKGVKTDGHRYLQSAIESGARALVVEEPFSHPEIPVIQVHDTRIALADLAAHFYGHPAREMTIIGITGTNGKTTTSYMIGEILKAAGKKPGIIGTIQIQMGDRIFPTNITTPESLEIQKYLAMMWEEGVEVVVMEVSSHALHFDRVHGIQFQGAVFTNLTRDHLDFHLSMDQYFEEKRKLFQRLKSAEEGGFALLNSDDLKTPELINTLDVPYMSYGIYRHPDLRARDIKTGISGTSFVAESERWDIPIRMGMVGKFNIYNALAAIGTGLFLNIPPAAISQGLANMSGVRGRFETVDEGQNFGVVVDYAHTPDGLKNVLESARKLTEKRVICVFGCGGDRDRTKRPIMGECASQLSDLVIVTSDNPRTEDPLAIINDIMPGVEKEKTPSITEPDRKTAIRRAIEEARDGDIVVIAGKGHETYQIFRDRTIDFDDVEVARQSLRDFLNGTEF